MQDLINKYMNKDFQIFLPNLNKLTISTQLPKFRFILVLISSVLIAQMQEARSDEIFLKCTGKFEINRGALIKPDWETSYLTINLDGLTSTINDKGLSKKGSTLIRRNSYTITQRDNRSRIKNIYKINSKHGTYILESPERNRVLIGNCQKGRG